MHAHSLAATLVGASLALSASLTTHAADLTAGQAKAQVCAACHGVDGNSANAAFPSIAGQGAPYLLKQLQDYKSGARANPIMAGQVASLSDEDMQNLAAWYASGTAKVAPKGEGSKDGARLWSAGNAEAGVPACAACHGPEGHGNPAAGYPALRGQHAGYLATSLRAYRDGSRANDAGSVMRTAARGLDDAAIDALVAYITHLE